MNEHFKPQDELDTENALGTLRQMIFFDQLQTVGISQEFCTQILADAFALPEQEALCLLYRIGRNRNYDEPIPSDLKTYLIEKGRPLLVP